MLKEIQGNKLRRGQKVYVFEYGEGSVLRCCGYDETRGEDIYEVQIGTKTYNIPSSNCFAIDKNGRRYRRWKLNRAEIEITENPIKIIFHGNPTSVMYSAENGDEELFEEGDILHKDWDGMGIHFAMIISKWLRRLNGEQVALSEYYKDPFNRFLDSLD